MARQSGTATGLLGLGSTWAPEGTTREGSAGEGLARLLAPPPNPLHDLFPRGTLGDDLMRDPRHYTFVQALRILQSGQPAAHRLGGVAPAKDERLRLLSSTSLGFPASDIVEIRPSPTGVGGEPEEGGRPRLSVVTTFLGLHGSQSPLPTWMNEEILDRDPDDNPRRDFLDFFHHRLQGFLPVIWEKYRYWAVYQSGARDPFSGRTFSFIGLYDSDLRQQSSDLNWERLLAYIGLLAGRNRSGDVVRGVIAHAFNLPGRVSVEEFVLRTVHIIEAQWNVLGRENCRLADDFHLGRGIPDRNGKFRLWLGPLGFDRFFSFLPHQGNFDTLRRLVAFMLRDQLAYDLGLKLSRSEAPPFRLNDEKCLLGWSTWLGTPPMDEDQTVILTARR
jgi:type VI secretion system protein ImpH